MEQLINEQTELKTHTVETDIETGEKKSEVSLGKFKDVEALVNAYNSLQSEFTKRCQKIKELEGKLENEKVNTNQDANQEQSTLKQQVNEKDQVLKEYLLDVLGKKPNAIVMDGAGVGVKTPVPRPTTIEEAGKLAQNLLAK